MTVFFCRARDISRASWDQPFKNVCFGCLFPTEHKKAKVGGRKCHAKTTMSGEASEAHKRAHSIAD
jgi:hypothetical protein